MLCDIIRHARIAIETLPQNERIDLDDRDTDVLELFFVAADEIPHVERRAALDREVANTVRISPQICGYILREDPPHALAAAKESHLHWMRILAQKESLDRAVGFHAAWI